MKFAASAGSLGNVELEGEAVVVTGGALGIGRACCERMAQASFVTGAELVIDGGYTAR